MLGAHACEIEGIAGTRFAVWAPAAQRVSVIGDWNHWDGRRHPMRVRGASGVWELFIPGVGSQAYYKYEIRNREHSTIHIKADPYGQAFEMRPATSANCPDPQRPINGMMRSGCRIAPAMTGYMNRCPIYEVHLGSWQRDEQGGVR